MQKQEIDKTLFLALQSTYEEIQIALYNKENLIEKAQINKLFASKDLIPTIDLLLKKNNFKIDDLTFLAVNQGPGPFTTLRVVISTVNALNFGGNLPLIPVDGLEAFLNEYESNTTPVKIILLNAFNNDVYYAIKTKDLVQKGWKNIDLILTDIKNQFGKNEILFLGNGTTLFIDKIKTNFAGFKIALKDAQFCAIESVAKIAYKKWQTKDNIFDHIEPLYLKAAVNISKKAI